MRITRMSTIWRQGFSSLTVGGIFGEAAMSRGWAWSIVPRIVKGIIRLFIGGWWAPFYIMLVFGGLLVYWLVLENSGASVAGGSQRMIPWAGLWNLSLTMLFVGLVFLAPALCAFMLKIANEIGRREYCGHRYDDDKDVDYTLAGVKFLWRNAVHHGENRTETEYKDNQAQHD